MHDFHDGRARLLGLALVVACIPEKGTSTTDEPPITTGASETGGTTEGTAPTSGGTTTTGTDGTSSGEGTTTGGATTLGSEETSTGDATTGAGTGTGDATTGAGTSTGDATTGESTGGDPDVLCEGTGQSSLPGVTIVFPPQDCSFTLAEAKLGVAFEYEVHVEADIPDVLRYRQDAGDCDEPGPSGLIVAPRISGAGQLYCFCNQGLCPGLDIPPVTLKAGVYPGTLEWNGYNWNGPHEDLGPLFPAGEYTVRQRAIGSWKPDGVEIEYEVLATLPITLVP